MPFDRRRFVAGTVGLRPQPRMWHSKTLVSITQCAVLRTIVRNVDLNRGSVCVGICKLVDSLACGVILIRLLLSTRLCYEINGH
jgi:hypothetical protein